MKQRMRVMHGIYLYAQKDELFSHLASAKRQWKMLHIASAKRQWKIAKDNGKSQKDNGKCCILLAQKDNGKCFSFWTILHVFLHTFLSIYIFKKIKNYYLNTHTKRIIIIFCHFAQDCAILLLGKQLTFC